MRADTSSPLSAPSTTTKPHEAVVPGQDLGVEVNREVPVKIPPEGVRREGLLQLQKEAVVLHGDEAVLVTSVVLQDLKELESLWLAREGVWGCHRLG